MKILLTSLKATTLLVFGSIMVLTIGAYLNLPLPLKPLVVQSGSMEPAIKTGSLVLVTKKPLNSAGISYVEGDIVTFKSESGLVSHRVVRVDASSGEKMFVTKGDANKTIDTKLITEKDVVGKVNFSIPYIGRFVDFVKQPLGFLLLIIIPTLLIIISEAIAIWEELKKKPVKKSHLDFAKPLSMFFMAAIFMSSSHAFFSDVATSNNNIFSAAESFGTDHLVISEVQINGDNANEDFVEIYNPTNSPVAMTGWQLQKKTSNATISSLVLFTSGTIPAHGYFLWANSQSGFAISIVADASNTNNLSENNSIALEDPSDNIIDQVAWGTGTSQFVEGTAVVNGSDGNSSIERKAISTSTSVSMAISGADEFKGNGFDSNNNSTDFILRTLSQPQNSSSATETP